MAADVLSFALGIGRRKAAATMKDACIITRAGVGEPDPVTGERPRVQVYPDPAWSAAHPLKKGPCKVQAFVAQESNREAAEADYTVQRYRVDVPVGSFEPEVDDEVTMTDVRFDPHLAGRKYRVVGPLHKTAATAYRLAVEEV